MRMFVLAGLLAGLCACSAFNDPATRLAYAIERGAGQLPGRAGATYTIHYRPPAKLGREGDSYTVQLDKAGALIVWYKRADGRVIESGSTSYQARFVVTPKTWILDKPGAAALDITLTREGGRAVVKDVR
jgi:hypothetical protein